MTSTKNRVKGDKDRSWKTSSEASPVIVGSTGVVAVAVARSDRVGGGV